MSNSPSKVVGVMGGMGPAATLHFLQALLAATPAERDQDHLRVLVDNDPHMPDRNAALTGGGPSPGPRLAAMAQGLERAGAEVLVMPCNTAHAFQAEIEAAIAIPFLSIVEATVDAAFANAPGLAAVGLLAAPGCLRAGLYQDAFAARGVRTIAPQGELNARLYALIYRIKAGEVGPDSRAEMSAIAHALIDQGADALASACTEAPLVLGARDVPVPLIDSTEALAAATVAFAAR